MDIYDAYDPFAQTYQRHWGAMVGDRWLSRIEDTVLAHVPEQARILDLCCGSGELSESLAKRGYRVTGLDGSSNMLALARESSPELEFIHADARDFSFDEPFDACLCMFDSLNHLMALEELANAFSNVHQALRSSGIFYFDMNMEKKYIEEWTGDLSFIDHDHVCAVQCAANVECRQATFAAAIFDRADTGWLRRDVQLQQTWYAAEEISTSLQSVGFRDVEPGFPEKADRHRMFVRCIA